MMDHRAGLRGGAPAAAQMLTALGVTGLDLLTTNPDKARQLRGLGIDVAETVPTGVHATPDNLRYLGAKVTHTRNTIALDSAVFAA
jgi:GTP cyclohydrolase II